MKVVFKLSSRQRTSQGGITGDGQSDKVFSDPLYLVRGVMQKR
jgi:hypothetical protein